MSVASLSRPPHQTLPATIHPDHVDNEKSPMKSELNRRKSFINWPADFISANDLAEQGFFYTQKSDIVKCAFCGLELGKWEAGDVPSVDHRTWSPHCPLVCDVDCGNIRMSDDEHFPPPAADEASFDTCGKYGIHLRPHSRPESKGPIDIQKYALKHTAAHPQYALLEERLRTYKDWPVSIKQRPEQLADAGFYYSGKSDQTICYSCGGGLKAWEEVDDPWEQHACWFPRCSFLRMHKSPEFIMQHSPKASGQNNCVPNAGNSSTVTKSPVPSLNSTQATTSTTASAPATTEAGVASATKDSPSSKNPVNLCKICYTNEIGVVFLPCGHMVACVDCAPALTKCAVCRRELEATVRAFLS